MSGQSEWPWTILIPNKVRDLLISFRESAANLGVKPTRSLAALGMRIPFLCSGSG